MIQEKSKNMVHWLKVHWSWQVARFVGLFLAADVLFNSFCLAIARIDTPEELQHIAVMDLKIGPSCALILFVWIHPMLKKSTRFWKLLLIYVVAAISISCFFIYCHFEQVAYRGGHPWKMLFM